MIPYDPALIRYAATDPTDRYVTAMAAALNSNGWLSPARYEPSDTATPGLIARVARLNDLRRSGASPQEVADTLGLSMRGVKKLVTSARACGLEVARGRQ